VQNKFQAAWYRCRFLHLQGKNGPGRRRQPLAMTGQHYLKMSTEIHRNRQNSVKNLLKLDEIGMFC
jgi:hypothetical protein